MQSGYYVNEMFWGIQLCIFYLLKREHTSPGQGVIAEEPAQTIL
jgi:hypothetical protein